MPDLFNFFEFFYSILTVVVTVLVVVLVKRFGNIPGSSIGTDLNTLTYGFLWDIVVKAIRNQEYWPNFNSEYTFHINKPSILLLICLINTILMAWNFKISHQVSTQNTRITRWFLKPFSLSLGIVSLFFFLFTRVVWGS